MFERRCGTKTGTTVSEHQSERAFGLLAIVAKWRWLTRILLIGNLMVAGWMAWILTAEYASQGSIYPETIQEAYLMMGFGAVVSLWIYLVGRLAERLVRSLFSRN